MRGFFITFEGGEGAGKSTQINRLNTYLKKKGRDVVVTREPGGSPGAEAVRHVILSGEAERFGAELEVILFAAARLDHLDQVIRPALTNGSIVLCDRFVDSTRAYQGITDNINQVFFRSIERSVVASTMPNLTIILDIDPAIGLNRASKRRGSNNADRFEKEQQEIHNFRREAFLSIAAAEPERCIVIDASQSEENIAVQIKEVVTSVMVRMDQEISLGTEDVPNV